MISKQRLTSIGAAAAIAAGSLILFGFGSCGHRGPPSWEDRAEKVDHVVEYLADDLDLRPDQRAQFDAFAVKVKAQMKTTFAHRQEAMKVLVAQLESDQLDTEVLGKLAKEHLRQAMQPERFEPLIDEGLALYDILDAEQQAEVREEISDKLRWFHH